MAAVPATQPHAAQLLALRAALDTPPPLPPRAALLDALLGAVHAAPAVPALRSAWQALNESLLELPSLAAAQPPMRTYELLQTTLASPPSAALEVTYQLQATLAAVPSLVAGGKRQVRATHLDTVGQLGLLERGLFGEDLLGYSSHVRAARPAID